MSYYYNNPSIEAEAIKRAREAATRNAQSKTTKELRDIVFNYLYMSGKTIIDMIEEDVYNSEWQLRRMKERG